MLCSGSEGGPAEPPAAAPPPVAADVLPALALSFLTLEAAQLGAVTLAAWCLGSPFSVGSAGAFSIAAIGASGGAAAEQAPDALARLLGAAKVAFLSRSPTRLFRLATGIWRVPPVLRMLRKAPTERRLAFVRRRAVRLSACLCGLALVLLAAGGLLPKAPTGTPPVAAFVGLIARRLDGDADGREAVKDMSLLCTLLRMQAATAAARVDFLVAVARRVRPLAALLDLAELDGACLRAARAAWSRASGMGSMRPLADAEWLARGGEWVRWLWREAAACFAAVFGAEGLGCAVD